MKLSKSDIHTESYGVQNSTSFGINNEDVGILLNILRTKIYKNPILAVCREITCNARDAHREAHNNPNNPTTTDTPIEIYLPNILEPTLKIKDFGPGISPQRKDIFVKFGASTKRNNNFETGGFGLGCKTPLAYGQSFTVDTIADAPFCYVKPRVRYVYNVYIDESQVGVMDLMYSEPTDEINQTSIIIPIKQEDFHKFEYTIIQCTKYWKVLPKLLGGDSYYRSSYPILKPLYQGSEWILYYEDNNKFTHASAVVDGIEYVIDKWSLSGRSNLHDSMLRYNFCINFGVGELTLAASRDNLHYDKQTIAKILARLDKIAEEIKEKIVEKITEATSYIEACNIYSATKKQLGYIVDNIDELKWNDYKLRTNCNINEIGSWAKLISYSVTANEHVLVNRVDEKIKFNNPSVMLIHNDKTKFLNKHIVLWLLQKYEDINTIQVIYTPDNPTSISYKQHIEKYGKKDIKIEYDMALLELLKPIKYSSIQVPKTKYLSKSNDNKRPALKKGNISGYTLYFSYDKIRYNKFHLKIKKVLTQFPRDDGGIYIVYNYKNNRFHSENMYISFENINKAKELLNEDIIGLTPIRAKMIADNPNWISLKQAMQDKIAPYEKEMSFDNLIKLIKEYNFIVEHKISNLKEKLNKIDNKQSSIILWYKKIYEIEKTINFYNVPNIINLYKWFNNNIPFIDSFDIATDGEIIDLFNKIKKQYPLLFHIKNTDFILNSLIEYINMADRYRSEIMMENLLINNSNVNKSLSTTA